MIQIDCVDCGRSGRFRRQPRRPDVRCPDCKALNSGVTGEANRDLRSHLLAYPVPLQELKRFYRVLVGLESFEEFHAQVLDDRCVATLYDLGVTFCATNHSPQRVEHRVRQAFSDGALGSATQHRLLSDLADEQGLEARAQREWRVAHLLISAMVESGDGSEASPFLVVDLADQYLVLEREQRVSLARYTCEVDGRFYDIHECKDGGEAWFDVTAQVESQARLNTARAG